MLIPALVTRLEGKTSSSKNQGKANTDVNFFVLLLPSVTEMQNSRGRRYFAAEGRGIGICKRDDWVCVLKSSTCKTGFNFGSKYASSACPLSR